MTATTIPTTGRRVEIHAGSRFTWHIPAESTGGALSVAEALIPAGGEPPLHVHAREDEAFYVLEGRMTFQRGVERVDAGPGDAVLLPRGIQHGFAVRTATARALLLMTPGTIEEAFHATATPVEPGAPVPPAPAGPPAPEEVERLLAAFAAHGVQFTGPPLPALLAEHG